MSQQRDIRVLHLDTGDVENDVFMEKVKVETDNSGTKEVSDEGSP